ncbi:MAG TPA: hypothetical protein VFV52_14935 [Bacilli bacterium]|nr:hypothetical protein [Bacilli bacterium]
MNKREQGMEGQVLLAVIGFFFFGVLSLVAGNSMLTSVTRAVIGMIALFGLGFLLRFAIYRFVGNPEPKSDLRGKVVDLVLPAEMIPKHGGNREPEASGELTQQEQAVEQQAMAEEFVPFERSSYQPKDVDDEEAKRMAKALRHLEE